VGAVVDSDFGPIVCDPHVRHVSRQLLKWGHYNPDEARKYQDLLQQSSTALIIGSHIGALTLQLAANVDKLTCIEANPRNYELLKLNVAMQNLSSKVCCVNVAVAERTGSVEFLCSRDNTGGSKIKPKHLDVDFRYDQPEPIQVATISLDTFFSRESFDFILMDIEGSEFAAIRGGQDLLQRCKIFSVEFVPRHVERVAGVSICDFAITLLSLDFDYVEFPGCGIKGDPREILLSTLLSIRDRDGYEDGIIFTRADKGIDL